MKTIITPFRQKRIRIGGIFMLCALSAGMLAAQSPAARIFSEANNAAMAAIKGSQHPLAQPQFDAGRMTPGTRLQGISVHFNLSPAQEASLKALLAAQQDPNSPQYHQWLTPDEFAARFGMAQADLDKVQTWLEQQGFSIDRVNRSRNTIRFSGTVGQVESAFQTQMHYYEINGEKHFAPSTALSVPSAFSSVVASVGNLNDFRPRPQHIVPRGQFTSGQSGNVFFAPGDIYLAYDMNGLLSGGTNGAGQTIAIMGQSFIHVSDIEAFESAAGLTKKDPTMVLVPGTGSDSVTASGDQSESDLDVEWSGAMAPGANIDFVYTGSNTNFGVFDSAQYAIDEKIGQIISLSYSSCETELSSTELTTLENMFSQAASQGQTVMAASGDQGSTACAGDTHLSSTQQTAIMVNYPASSAFVTGVGGTEIDKSNGVDPTTGNKGANFSTYWNSTSGTDITNSLKQYIPEVAWNDDALGAGLSSSGGGASTLVARPSWQTGVPGIPSGNTRLVPDISFYSSAALPGYLYCTSDTSAWQTVSGGGSNNQQASCNSGFRDAATNDLTVAGGTSFATPIFAGMLADINQKLNYTTGQGEINATLYQLAANSTTYASAFHDVTSGNNNCTAGSKYCGSTTSGFSAGAGYDEVTGLGSLDIGNLVGVGGATGFWPTAPATEASLIGTTTSVSAQNATTGAATNDVFTVTVASNSGASIPTGSVTLQIDGGTTSGGTTVSGQALSASGTLTYTANFATCGTHQVLAQYGGDVTHAPSVGIAAVIVSGTCPGFKVGAADLTVKQGSSGTSTITITPSTGYTGTVDLTFTTSDNTSLSNLCYSFTNMNSNGVGTVQVSGTSAVTTQLTLDTNAADCVSAAAVKGSGMRAVKMLQSGSGKSAQRGNGSGAPGKLPAGLALAGLLFAGLLGRASRKLRGLACVIALAAIGLGMSACGGGGSGGSSVSNPPKGTYTVTVTGTDATSSAITSNTTFNFTIK